NVRLALKQTNGNVAKAANMLEVSRKTLYVWMSKHGIEKGFGKRKRASNDESLLALNLQFRAGGAKTSGGSYATTTNYDAGT
ncbi:helix-turn-helix domain-containing protein, partial [uncultured Duncaniella sp.]|uniref:helix-turn-helix domain-containing protein n=1 Tax=uncultured Duncaniella sp. TaxID=2768039 RepID=UPI00261CC991